MTRNLDEKGRKGLDEDLDRMGRQLEKLARIKGQMGTPALAAGVEPLAPEAPRVGRWRRQAPPGWDDATVQRDAQRALRGLSKQRDVQADG